MARKIFEGTCPYCGNELTIDPVGETKTYKERPRYPKVGDIRHCPFCSWRYQVSDVRKNRLVLSEYINANRMRRKEKKEKELTSPMTSGTLQSKASKKSDGLPEAQKTVQA